MGNYKGPSEGGSGGKRGHSNMEHWTFTEELKESSKKSRRLNSKKEIRKELNELSQKNDSKEPKSRD